MGDRDKRPETGRLEDRRPETGRLKIEMEDREMGDGRQAWRQETGRETGRQAGRQGDRETGEGVQGKDRGPPNLLNKRNSGHTKNHNTGWPLGFLPLRQSHCNMISRLEVH